MVYASGTSAINSPVQHAVEGVCRLYEGHLVSVVPDGSGGAFVIVCDVKLSEKFSQESTWLGFQVSFLYPASDVYPHYVRPDLTRRDGTPLGAGLSPIIWPFDGRSALQVSRRSNRWDPRVDTAALKAVKVMAWMNE